MENLDKQGSGENAGSEWETQIISETRAEFFENISSGSRTEPSERHPARNEDALINSPELGLFAALDGVQGHYGGKEASNLAAEAFKNFFELKSKDPGAAGMEPEAWVAAMRSAFLAARAELDKFIAEKKLLDRPNTTVSIAKVIKKDGKNYAVYGNAGDSRIYKFSPERGLEQLTVDDDALDELDKTGTIGEADRKKIRERLSEATKDEELEEVIGGLPLRTFFNFRNLVSNSLGKFKTGDSLKIGYVELLPGEQILITSDGIHDNLTKSEIAAIVAEAKTPEEAAQKLIEAAKAVYPGNGPKKNIRAKKDDMTAVMFGLR